MLHLSGIVAVILDPSHTFINLRRANFWLKTSSLFIAQFSYTSWHENGACIVLNCIHVTSFILVHNKPYTSWWDTANKRYYLRRWFIVHTWIIN